MIKIISKKKKHNKQDKQTPLQKLQKEFQGLDSGLVRDIFDNLGQDFELSWAQLLMLVEEQMNEEVL